MKAIFFFILIVLSQITQAQRVPVIPLYNPSFEGPRGIGVCPPEWETLSGTPDVLPYAPDLMTDYNQQVIPTNEFNFLLLAYSKEHPDYAETIGQTLRYPFFAGVTYTVSFDLAIYYYPLGVSGAFGFAGSNGKFDTGELLWESGEIYHSGWKRFTVQFTPTQNITYFYIYSYNPGVPDDGKYPSGGVLVDNFSPVKETLPLILTATRTCIGKTTGSVSVHLPGPATDYTISWLPGGYTTPTVQNLPSGTYEVTVVQLKDGRTATLGIDVGISDPRLTKRIKQISCYNKTDALIQVTAARGLSPYQYFLNEENNMSGLFNNIGPGHYTIKAIDSLGCSVQEDILLAAPSRFSLDKITVRNIPCTDASNGQIILAASGGTTPYTYSIPGYTSQPDSIFSQLSPGTYHYRITDSTQCMIDSIATISKTWGPCAVYVPNAFSPNGDGINDLFHVKVQDDVSDYRMAVYGRWGQLIYETHQPEAGWDGTFKGKKLPAGSYIWSVTYTDNKDQLMKQQGSVVLIN